MNLPEMNPPELQFLRRLRDAGVSFVIVGGHSVVVHGYRRTTEDLDLVWLAELFADSIEIDGLRFTSLAWLRRMKEGAGRLKDQLDLQELDRLYELP